MKSLLTFSLLFFTCLLLAQQPPATPGVERLQSMEQRKMLQDKSLLNEIPFESVGPSVFGGRIVDLDVNPTDPSIFYAAYASGGLWKTENNGASFTPIFDHETVMTIGDIAVDWKKNIIWVGTGENNSSRSSYAGVGMYKSMDGGQTWDYKGLPESHHIGRIILHPTNPDILWVAALGHLYSANEERGVYKTTDGGLTWTKTLYAGPNAGAVDLVIDPSNPDILYAATWHRERRAWNFVESGNQSGIYKSTDGGLQWTLLNQPASGFPTGEGVGRIGLAIAKKGDQTVLYASLDNYERRPASKEKKSKGLSKNDFKEMTPTQFGQLEEEALDKFLTQNRFPKKYSASQVQKLVKKGKIQPADLAEYLEDANALLFDTPVIGAEVYRSDDDGQSWSKTHEGYLDNLFYSYGYYFGQIRISPHDLDKIYILGVPVLRSDDGGATFKSINGANVHADHHALWVSPIRDEHLILGNDGGVNISHDDGANWFKCNTPPVGQFYTVAVDHAKPYHIFGGLQDNGVWRGPSTYQASNRWHNTGKYPYQSILGGDGMQVAVDTRDNNTVYTGYQFGFYYRINLASDDYKLITPKHDLGETKLRWNWQTPIHLSVHNQDILYMGSQKVHRSMDQGDNFKTISDDLTSGGRKGDVPYGTLTTIHESPLLFGLLYAGADDGNLHVTRDGGRNWENISKGLPPQMWVTKVQASAFAEGRVYVSLNGYRWDDFTAYVFRSDDYGNSWTPIGTDLPGEPVNVIKEDPKNENIIYVGTDHGLYVSLDKGATFMSLGKGLPAAAVHDLVVHPMNNDLIVATHARSFYKTNVAVVQAMSDEIQAKPLHLFAIEDVPYRKNWGTRRAAWQEVKEPALMIPVYSSSKKEVEVSIKTEKGFTLKSFKQQLEPGVNFLTNDLSIDSFAAQKLERLVNETIKEKKNKVAIEEKGNGKYYLYKGTYTVEVSGDGAKEEGTLVISGK